MRINYKTISYIIESSIEFVYGSNHLIILTIPRQEVVLTHDHSRQDVKM